MLRRILTLHYPTVNRTVLREYNDISALTKVKNGYLKERSVTKRGIPLSFTFMTDIFRFVIYVLSLTGMAPLSYLLPVTIGQIQFNCSESLLKALCEGRTFLYKGNFFAFIRKECNTSYRLSLYNRYDLQ